jgi:betaine reductase
MPVIKGFGNTLIHAPNLLFHYGSTQVMEALKGPDNEHAKKLASALRGFEDAVSYAPNQAYIGNIGLEELSEIPRPWFSAAAAGAGRKGKHGEILPEDEFYGLLKLADTFDLVSLEKAFASAVAGKLAADGLCTNALLDRLGEGKEAGQIASAVEEGEAVGLWLGEALVGCVRQAHKIDEELSAHVMLENLVTKASGLAAALSLSAGGVEPASVEYVIECSEEACGDMNQRGGGNFAKSIAELAGFRNATGSDVRGFCAGPVHAILHAASLVDAGVFSNVVVLAGGAVAKLGMNSRDHLKKGMPALEDMLGAFAVLISADDGVNPRIRMDVLGRHTVGTGSSPQQVMQALVSAPLQAAGLALIDVDKYAGECRTPSSPNPRARATCRRATIRWSRRSPLWERKSSGRRCPPS